MSDFIGTFTLLPVAPFYRVQSLLLKWQHFATKYNIMARRLLAEGFIIDDVGTFNALLSRGSLDDAHSVDGVLWSDRYGTDFLPVNDSFAPAIVAQFQDVARFQPLLFPNHWEESYATILVIDPPPSPLQQQFFATAGRAACGMLQIEAARTLALSWNLEGRRG